MVSLRTMSSVLPVSAYASDTGLAHLSGPLPVITDSGLTVAHTGGPARCLRPTRQGDTIAVNYRGTLQSDGKEFDSSYNRHVPIEFVLGVGRVIAGWDEGLEKMCVGESRTLTIPPHLAYGSSGQGPIPPDSTLVFETRLEAIVTVAPGSEPLPDDGVPGMPTSTPTATATSSPTPTREGGVTESTTLGDRPEASHGMVGDEEPGEGALGEGGGSEVPAGAMKEEGQAECKLLGPFALLVQGALGALALLTLVWKRWREEPKRPWKIFVFDVSKQVLGSFLTHIINLAMSMLGSDDVQNAAAHAVSSGGTAFQDAAGRTPNPCSYYLLNLGIDTTVGVPVLYVLLKILHALFLATPLARPPQSIKSGNYGSPARFTWYLKQLLIYCIGLVGMKLFVLFLFMALPWLPWIGDWALRWTKGNEALEITFALFIFPLIMNAVQYWVIDSFIMDKKKDDQRYQQVAGEDDDEERRGMLADDDTVVEHGVRGKSPNASGDDSPTASQSRGGGRASRADRSKQA